VHSSFNSVEGKLRQRHICWQFQVRSKRYPISQRRYYPTRDVIIPQRLMTVDIFVNGN